MAWQHVDRAGQPAGAAAAVLDVDLDVLGLDDHRVGRGPQVALAVRRVLEQLAVAGQVALGRRDVAVGLDAVEPAAGPPSGTQRWVVARGRIT